MTPCIRCGQLIDAGAGSYCPRHRPRRDSPGRGGGAAIRSYRRRALERDGYRCRALLPDNSRCPTKGERNLEVHHLQALAAGGTHALANLVTVCRRHHRELEREALARRMPRVQVGGDPSGL